MVLIEMVAITLAASESWVDRTVTNSGKT